MLFKILSLRLNKQNCSQTSIMRITEGLTYHVTEPVWGGGGRSPFRLPDFSELHLLRLEMGFEDIVSFGPNMEGQVALKEY